MPEEESSPDPEPEPGGALPGSPDLLRPDVLIVDLIEQDPYAARVLAEEFGLPCYRCPARYVETLAAGISYRELSADQVLARLRELHGVAGP